MEEEKPLALAPAQVALKSLTEVVKSNLAVVVAVAIVVVVLLFLRLTTETLQSPQDALDRQIAVEVEKAKRMLNNYQPGGQELLAAVGVIASQPEAEFAPEDQWPASLKSLQERLDAAEGELQPLRSQFDRLTGDGRSLVSAASNYSQLKEKLDANLNLIDEALAIVQKAVNMSVEGPEGPVTGRLNPAATQLEAILIYHRADLLRRKAAIERDEAVAARAGFDELCGWWQAAQSQIAAIEAVTTIAESRPASRPVETTPTKPAKAGGEPKKDVDAKTAAKPATGGGPAWAGLLAKFLYKRAASALSGKEGAEGAPPPAEEEVRAPEPAIAKQPEQPETPAPEPQIPAPAVVVAPPTPEQRLSELKVEREEAVAKIAAAEADVARLRAHKSSLEQALASWKKTALEAQLRMMRLEEQGVDPVEEGAMDRFLTEYRRASEQYREATREATLLEKGGIRNARPGTDDEQELLEAPLVPADPSRPMKPSEGLVSVEKALKAAEDQLQASREWLESIDAQVAAVNLRREADAQRLASLRKLQASLKERATAAVKTASAASAKADELALQAVDLLSSQGARAAQNARQAIDAQRRDAQSRQVPGTENARLDMILNKTGFLVGYAQTLEGDLALMTAYIQAERSADLRLQARMLKRAESMGIASDVRAEPAYIYQPAAASKAAEDARKQAIEAANEARSVYYKADGPLKSLWVLHANVAAVHYLLAVLETGEEAAKNRELAIKIYQGALQDRQDRPEAEKYRLALEGLTRAGQ